MWILLGIVCLVIPLTLAIASYIVQYSMNLESLGDNPILQNNVGTPISEIPGLSLYIGESQSTYFRLANIHSSDIDVSLGLSFSSINFGMVGSPTFGYRVGAGTWLTADLGDTLTIPFESYLEFDFEILNIDAGAGTGYNAILHVTVLD